jgi:hypothetical protein
MNRYQRTACEDQQAGKDLTGAVVICKMWILAVSL